MNCLMTAPLVVAYGLDVHAGRLGEAPDGQFLVHRPPLIPYHGTECMLRLR